MSTDNIIPFPLKRQLARQMAKSIAESTLTDINAYIPLSEVLSINEYLAIIYPFTRRGRNER